MIEAGEDPPEGVRTALLRRFERCSWLKTYVAAVRKLLCRYDVYSFFRCFPYIRDAGYGEEFKDVGEGQTSLSGEFLSGWLAFGPHIYCTEVGTPATWSPMFQVCLPVSLGMTNCT